MTRSLLVSGIFLCAAAWAPIAAAQEPATLSAVTALTNREAKQHPPVSFEGTVTYFRAYENVLFVQDGEKAIFVATPEQSNFAPGDRVLVRGTMRASFRPFVKADEIRLLRHEPLPKPVPVSVEQLMRADADCRLVTVHAVVQSADLVMSPVFLRASTTLRLLVDGEPMEATINNDDANALKGLLDADVEITGVVSGKFDAKMQETGVVFLIQSMDGIKILKHETLDPWSIAVTPMDRILTGHREIEQSQRMRVHGTVTYYQPAEALVLQDGSKSLWIISTASGAIRVGDLADAIGFPDVQNGFLTLRDSEVRDSAIQEPIVPRPSTWADLAVGGNDGLSHLFDLVSIEGQVVTEVRHATQDEYVVQADNHLFSAILRHPRSTGSLQLAPLMEVPVGSRIRVTGICMLAEANPFNGDVPFNILMRSSDDVQLIAKPGWLNVAHLTQLVIVLLAIIFVIGIRYAYSERKTRRKIARLAYAEQRRGKILEDMNNSRPLAEILEHITELVSLRLNGAPCWCEVADGARLGNCPANPSSATLRIAQMPIPARSGPPLGMICAALPASTHPRPAESEALSLAAGLATLAIETSRLYSDLVHRSEFDLLTDIQNRFSLEKYLDKLIHSARQSASIFGLLYIDLNDFKQVNDVYGHRAGDFYLQQVSVRMKRQLRPGDMLARLGGDEFAVLVPDVRCRADADEIAHRLEGCFELPFEGDGYVIHGSASVGIATYPADGTTKDSLLSAADAAMYVSKQTRARRGTGAASELVPGQRK
jgi:diguanylate cyclase (GGDEF)-like protein